jgi:hypothetical protein
MVLWTRLSSESLLSMFTYFNSATITEFRITGM